MHSINTCVPLPMHFPGRYSGNDHASYLLVLCVAGTFLLENFPWSSRSSSTPVPPTPTHTHTPVPAPDWCYTENMHYLALA